MKIGKNGVAQFAKKIYGKHNLYCFGAGIAFKRFLTDFHKYCLENDIKSIVDNSVEKQGTVVIHNDRSFPVISLDRMLSEIKLGDIILITTAKYLEVIKQLEKEEKLRDTECYLHILFRIEQCDDDRFQIEIPTKLSIFQEYRIPKTIHYCWFGKKEIPLQYKKWMESWKKFCPDYEIIEWSEKNYDVHKTKYLSQAYDLGKWAFVSDYARVDIIREYGGIYLDTDVELLKNIDEMLMNDGFCGFESSRYVAYGLGFGAIKNHPIIDEIKEYYDNTSFVSEQGALNQINCPIIQTEIMKRHGLKCNGGFQVVGGMAVYPSRILCGMSPHSFRVERNPVAYAIHHFSASWGCEEQLDTKEAIISYMKQQKPDDRYCYMD